MRMLRCAGQTSLLLASALTAQHSWQQIDGPTLTSYLFSPSTFYAPSAFDGSRNRLVLVDHAERLFEHDGVRWLYRGLARNAAFLLHDPVAARMLRGAVQGNGDLRIEAWDGAVWAMQPGVLAGLNGWGAPAFDIARNRLVLLGALGPSLPLSIFEWDGAAWQQAATLPLVGAYVRATAWDPVQARTMVVVQTSTQQGQVWTWDGTTASLSGPVGEVTSMGSSWNPVTNRFEFVGTFAAVPSTPIAGVFAWTGSTFVQVAPFPPMTGSGLGVLETASWDAAGRIHFVHVDTLIGLGEVMVLENGTWHRTAYGNGGMRANGCMAFEPVHGTVVYTGGYAGHLDRFGGTSLWNGTAWAWSNLSPSPPRGHSGCATDPLGRGIVLFGGEADLGNPLVYVARGDTWLWNGNTWQSMPSGGVPPRSFCAMTLDSARQRVVLSGGMTTSGVPFAYLQDAWEWNGVAWFPVASMPRRLARHAMAYDAARGRTVVFGGYDGTAFGNDTLEWDGVTWLQHAPTTRPPAGLGGMAYDPDRNLTTLVVNAVAGREAWHWDGSAWTHDPAAVPYLIGPTPSYVFGFAPQLVFDPLRRRLLYHDGASLHAFSPTPAGGMAYGSGCGSGVRLVLATPPRPGGGLHFDVLDVVPQGLTAVGLGLGVGNLGLGHGCTLLVQPTVGSQFSLANASGFASVRFPIPNSLVLRGVTVHAQGASLDPNSPAGFSLTAGIAATVGD